MVEVPLTLDPDIRAAAEHALDIRRMQAGQEYLDALRRLGLEPDVFCWIYDAAEDEIELAIVTSLAERVGSLDIYRLLFRAYEAAATPRDIDPFIVSIYGPNSSYGAMLRDSMRILAAHGAFSEPDPLQFTTFIGGSAEPKVILAKGVYAKEEAWRSAAQDLKRWSRFKQNVEALAA